MPEGIGNVAASAAVSAQVGTAGGDTGTTQGTTTPPNGGGQGKGDVAAKAPANPAQGNPNDIFEVKVDGQVVKMTRDEIIRNASLGKAAFKRMEEAGQKTRQAEEFIRKFQQDPMAALDHPALGLTPQQKRDAIEKYYQKTYIEQDKLTPEQKKLREVETELDKYRKDDADRKVKETQTQAQKLEEHYRGNYQKTIIETLEKSGLPKNPKTVARMAFYMHQAAANKFDAPMDVIVQHVRQDYQNDIADFTRSLEGDALVNFLGGDLVKKLQRHIVQEHRKRAGQPPVVPQNDTPPSTEPKRGGPPKGWGGVNKYWTRDR